MDSPTVVHCVWLSRDLRGELLTCRGHPCLLKKFKQNNSSTSTKNKPPNSVIGTDLSQSCFLFEIHFMFMEETEISFQEQKNLHFKSYHFIDMHNTKIRFVKTFYFSKTKYLKPVLMYCFCFNKYIYLLFH